MKVIIEPIAFDPYVTLSAYQKNIRPGSYGAVVSFVGVMRDFNDDENVTAMTLEYYPGMTEKKIEEVCQEALAEYPIDDALVVHRVGDISPDEPLVLVAVWSAHRSAGFDGCRYIINYLKQRAPFWKSEKTPQGSRWVAGNTHDPEVK